MNVVREDSGKIWLVDFGAVRDVYRSATIGGSTVAGTFGYMAPEQLHGVARPESDLYGLSATLITVLSGQSPADMPQRKLKTDFRSHVRVSRSFADWLEPADRTRARGPVPRRRARGTRGHAVLAPVKGSSLTDEAVSTAILFLTMLGASAFALHEFRASLLARVGAGAARAQGPVVATAGLPDRPQHWAFPAVTFERSIPSPSPPVMSAAAPTPDSTRLVTGSYDETARIIDAHTGHFLAGLPSHTTRIGAVRVLPDGRSVLTAGDHTLRLWTLPDGKPIRTIDVLEREVFGADVSPTGTLFASGTSGGLAKIWAPDGTLVRTLNHGGPRVLAVAFTLDESRLVTAGDDAAIRVWNPVGGGSLACTLTGHTRAIGNVAMAPDGQILASASDDHSVNLKTCGPASSCRRSSLHARRGVERRLLARRQHPPHRWSRTT